MDIATYSIALGVIVMIIAVSILRGFQSDISDKVSGFGSHIVIKSYQLTSAYEEEPISTQRKELDAIKQHSGVKHVQFFANKGGMIKTQDQIHGVIFKGVNKDFDTTFFGQNIVAGRLFSFPDSTTSNEVIISQTIANKLNLDLGDKVRSYFWSGDNYRARAFTISGIYNTDLSEFDEHYIVGDIRQVQRMNNWDTTQVAGYEIYVDDFNKLNPIATQLLQDLDYDLTLNTIVESYPALFSWLDLLNTNIILIISIMAIVCIVAVISALLIMIFEKTSTIGLLKTIGATNQSIRKIFLIKSTQIITKGVLIGEIIAFAFCWIQSHFQIIKLDSESYSMSCVPVDMNPLIYLTIGIGTILVCLIAMMIPTSHISKINPAKTIKVE